MTLAPDHTIGEALGIVAARLLAADIDGSRREARMLVAAALGLDLAGLILHEARPLGAAHARIEALLGRRCANEPLSRILGEREFYGLTFRLNAATLDPRPDTETLVDAVLARLEAAGCMAAPLRLIDLGTGTGAILLALLNHLPAATGIGVDIAAPALDAARENAERLALAGRTRFVEGDMLTRIEGRFDVVASNPPYIPSGEIVGLDPEVRLFDPHLALDGGADGLDFYRRIVAEAPAHLAEEGILALEVGAGQAGAAAALLERHGFTDIRVARDLGGIERVVIAGAPAGS